MWKKLRQCKRTGIEKKNFMLKYKDGGFHADGASFQLPEGAYIDTDPETLIEQGFICWLENYDVWFDILLDGDSGPMSALETLFAHENSPFVPYFPITEISLNGMKGHEVFYHDSKWDYYECHLDVSEDVSVILNVRCPKGGVENLKSLPEIQEVLKNIKIEV